MRNTIKTIEELARCQHVARVNVDGKVLICPECGSYRLTDNAMWIAPMLKVRLVKDVKDELPPMRDHVAALGDLAEQLSASLVQVHEFAVKADFKIEAEPLEEVAVVAKEIAAGIHEIAGKLGVKKIDLNADTIPPTGPIPYPRYEHFTDCPIYKGTGVRCTCP